MNQEQVLSQLLRDQAKNLPSAVCSRPGALAKVSETNDPNLLESTSRTDNLDQAAQMAVETPPPKPIVPAPLKKLEKAPSTNEELLPSVIPQLQKLSAAEQQRLVELLQTHPSASLADSVVSPPQVRPRGNSDKGKDDADMDESIEEFSSDQELSNDQTSSVLATTKGEDHGMDCSLESDPRSQPFQPIIRTRAQAAAQRSV